MFVIASLIAACSALGFLTGLGTGYGSYGGYPGIIFTLVFMVFYLSISLTFVCIFVFGSIFSLSNVGYGGNYGYGRYGGIFKFFLLSFLFTFHIQSQQFFFFLHIYTITHKKCN